MDRRSFVTGGVAIVATGALSGASAAAGSGELECLIAAHTVALEESGRRYEVYNDFEKRKYAAPGDKHDPNIQAEEARLLEWMDEANSAEDDAVWAFCEYRPQSHDEVRRLTGHILQHVPQVESLDGAFFATLLESLSHQA